MSRPNRRFAPQVDGLEGRVSLSYIYDPTGDLGCPVQVEPPTEPAPVPLESEPPDYPGFYPPFVPIPPAPIGPAGPAF